MNIEQINDTHGRLHSAATQFLAERVKGGDPVEWAHAWGTIVAVFDHVDSPLYGATAVTTSRAADCTFGEASAALAVLKREGLLQQVGRYYLRK